MNGLWYAGKSSQPQMLNPGTNAMLGKRPSMHKMATSDRIRRWLEGGV